MSRVTMKQVAAQAGISYTTVSMVLNKKSIHVREDTRARILRIARELNYRPNHFAGSMKKGRTGIVGVSICGMDDRHMFRHPYLTDLYTGIVGQANKSLQRVLFHNFTSNLEFEQALDSAASKLVDGLIFVYPAASHRFIAEELTRLRQLSVPCVVIHSLSENIGMPNIGFNVREAGAMAARHLLSYGYGSLVCVVPDQTNPLYSGLAAGFQNALPDPAMVRIDECAGQDPKAGRRYIARLVEQGIGLPRAFFATDDSIASGMLLQLRKTGYRIPEDVALIGFGDNVPQSMVATDLTSVRQAAAEKGKRAVMLLQKLLNDPQALSADYLEVLEPTLTIRESCGKNRPMLH